MSKRSISMGDHNLGPFNHIAKGKSELAPAICYASGEQPARGDAICHESLLEGGVRILTLSMEQRQTWIVTSIVGDMVRCKCDGAENWRQAHYTNQMRLLKRKQKRHNKRSSRWRNGLAN